MTSPATQECTRCWCLVTTEMVKAHQDYHAELDIVREALGKTATALIRLQIKFLEMRGNTP